MLSGETTTGKQPVECVRLLNRISARIEAEIQPGLTEELKLFRPKAKMLRSAAMLAMRIENSAVLVFTRSGDLAAKLGLKTERRSSSPLPTGRTPSQASLDLGNRAFPHAILRRSRTDRTRSNQKIEKGRLGCRKRPTGHGNQYFGGRESRRRNPAQRGFLKKRIASAISKQKK